MNTGNKLKVKLLVSYRGKFQLHDKNIHFCGGTLNLSDKLQISFISMNTFGSPTNKNAWHRG
jgi:hypothetical protein